MSSLFFGFIEDCLSSPIRKNRLIIHHASYEAYLMILAMHWLKRKTTTLCRLFQVFLTSIQKQIKKYLDNFICIFSNHRCSCSRCCKYFLYLLSLNKVRGFFEPYLPSLFHHASSNLNRIFYCLFYPTPPPPLFPPSFTQSS